MPAHQLRDWAATVAGAQRGGLLPGLELPASLSAVEAGAPARASAEVVSETA